MKHKYEIFRYIILFLIGVFATISCENQEYQFSHGNIFGTITDATTGFPIENCNISVSNSEGNIEDKQATDSKGTYKTKDLSDGYYTVSIEKEDYYTGGSKKVQVKSGETTKCDLALSRIPASITADTDKIEFGADNSLTSLSFKIVNRYLDALDWDIEYHCEWIQSVSPKKGTLAHSKTETIIIMIDRAKLSLGENKTNIIVKSQNGQGGVNISVSATGEGIEVPIVNAKAVTKIDKTSAILNGEIIKSGVPAYTKRGFTCSMTSKDDSATELFAELNDNAEFSFAISDLTPGKKYYVRAFAINNWAGKVWSTNEISFTTTTTKASVNTLPVTEIDINNKTACFNAEITEAGLPTYSERGFCYNYTGEPTINDEKIVISGNGSGKYSYHILGLNAKQIYYVRAYIIQNDIVLYGSTVNFKTEKELLPPTVVTLNTTGISATTATLNGNITEVGNPVYSEKGFCYATYNEPTINSNKVKVSGNNSGPFSASINNLDVYSKYYARAYAIQSGEVYYGDVVEFNMNLVSAICIATGVSELSYSSVTLNGNVTSVGDPTITARGFSYSTDVNPYIYKGADYVIEDANSSGSYKLEVNLSDLLSGQIYYVKAFVVQCGIYVYSDNYVTFTTSPDFEVVTLNELVSPSVEKVGTEIFWSGTIAGGFNSNISYISSGFVMSESPDPLIGKSNTSNIQFSGEEVSGSTRMVYSDVTGLKDKHTYYIKCYVKTTYGIKYSEQVQIMPKVQEPVFQTYNYANLEPQYIGSSIQSWKCDILGILFSDGVPGALEWGFVYGTSSNLTVGDGYSITVQAQKTQKALISGKEVYVFGSNINNLQNNKTIYYRTYIRTKLGYYYGGVMSFITSL